MTCINNPLILIIDDEEAILHTLQQALQDEGYRVKTLQDGNKALDVIGSIVPDLVILDIFMPNCNGIKLLSDLKKEYPDQKVIMISGYGNIPLAIESLKNGANDFIEKPLSLDDVLAKIDAILELKNSQQAAQELAAHNNRLEGMVGESYTFKELLNQAYRIAPYNYPVIISGQQGTGKSTLAKFIHAHSAFYKNELHTIPCYRLTPKEQQEYIKQAFASLPATIFFEHIDYLTPDNQKYLLSLLESDSARNFRIIASSLSSLYHLSKSGAFNSFLFYHLNVVPLEIPPLAKHQHDIPFLINYFLGRANQATGKSVVLSTSAIRQLRNYAWHGNITELKTVIERITLLAPTENHVVLTSDLITILGERNTQIVEEQSYFLFNSLKDATTTFEKNFLIYLMKKNHYNLEQVSHRLSIPLMQLRNKLLELKIEIKGEK